MKYVKMIDIQLFYFDEKNIILRIPQVKITKEQYKKLMFNAKGIKISIVKK